MLFRWQRSFPGIAALSLAMSASAVGLTSAQETQSTQQTQSTAGGLPVTANSGRRLAADAIHIISPNLELGDTVEGPVTLPLKSASQLEWTPNFAPVSETLVNKVKDQVFRNEIWGFELGFKPVRMIGVDMTDPATGESKTKVVWYLLYYVKYKGGDVVPKAEKDEFGNDVYNPTPTAGRVQRHFIPSFTLNSTSLGKRVDCKLIPQAIPLITEKERVGKPVYDHVAIQRVPLKLSTELESNEVWGVATWTDIDPRTDFFSVEIRGLTNAQQTTNVDGKLEIKQKTLVLNFSRPGDTINELADIIRYGVPALADPALQKRILAKYGLRERLDHYWVYR